MVGFVAVHTGAGNCINETTYKAVCLDACKQAIEVLKNGGTSMDACEIAIISLENCASTNAGFGSNLSWDKTIECDASIMDGKTLNFGACTNITNIKNPIRLARSLCDRQSQLLKFGRIPPMIVSGDGASKFAKEVGIPLINTNELISQKALNCYNHYKGTVQSYESQNNIKLSPLDTVGATCVDGDGYAVAGCSSGGLILKVPGRVGQAACYGAGCWAISRPDKSCCTCTTGNGEYLIKTLLAKEIVEDLYKSECPITSLHKTFKEKFLQSPYLINVPEIYGGSLSLFYDPQTGHGDVLWSHTTKSMCIGYMSTTSKRAKFLHSDLPTNCHPGQKTVVSGKHFNLPI